MEKSKKTYQELKLLRDQLRQDSLPDIYVKKELMDSESESEMARYVKQGLGRVSAFLSLVLFLISVPLLTITTFLLLLMAGFVMLGIFVKDLVVELIQLCSGPFSLGQRKRREI